MKKTSKKQNKKNSWENNHIIRIVFVLIIVVSLGIMFGTAGYSLYKWNKDFEYRSRIISVNYVNTSVQVVSYGAGMNGDIDALKFGKTTPGGGGERYLIINSTKEAIVEITIVGEMNKFLTVDKNDFIIKPNMKDQITFYLEIPNDTVPGNYSGTVQVVFLKP